MQYVGITLFIQLIASVGMLAWVLNLSSVCRDGSSYMMLLYIVLYVMMPVLTVIYGCYRVLFCFLHVK